MIRFVTRLAMAGIFSSMCVTASFAGSPTADAMATAPTKGIRAEILWQLTDLEKKFEDLAAAMPADKYSWRPMEGVRSVSEVYTHIIGANYLFMSFLNIKPPMKMDPAMEKNVTDKDAIAKMFKPSFDHVRTAVIGLSDKDLEKTTKMFGSPATYRAVLLAEIGHLHEHLGQSIAYARMNNVVPPWTAAEQAAAKKDTK
ncbi:MAG: DinB family protein [Bacteroidota bacterium]